MGKFCPLSRHTFYRFDEYYKEVMQRKSLNVLNINLGVLIMKNEKIDKFFQGYSASKGKAIIIEGEIFDSDLDKIINFEDFRNKTDFIERNSVQSVMTFERKYTSVYSMPSCTFNEIKESFLEIRKLLNRWDSSNPNTLRRTYGESIINSLSPSQKDLARSNSGLPINRISQYQAENVMRMLSYFNIGLKNEKLNIESLLIDGESRIAKKRIAYIGGDVYGLDKTGNFTPFIEISSRLNLKKQIHVIENGYSETLENLFRTISIKHRLNFVIEDCLREKKINFFGLANGNYSDILRSITSLYHLRFISRNANTFEIKRKAPLLVKDRLDIYPAIFDLIPYPLVKYYFGNKDKFEINLFESIQNGIKNKIILRTDKILYLYKLISEDAENLLSQKNTTVFRNLRSDSKIAYGILQIFNFLDAINTMYNSPPPIYFSRFTELVISLKEDKYNKNIFLQLPDQTGKLRNVTGMSIPVNSFR